MLGWLAGTVLRMTCRELSMTENATADELANGSTPGILYTCFARLVLLMKGHIIAWIFRGQAVN